VYRTVRNNIETIPACIPSWENFPTYDLPVVLLLVQPVENSVQYKTVELHQKRRSGWGSSFKKSLNFFKILGFWLVNTPDPGMSGMSGTSHNFYIISWYSL
jgi:hypothetical protein